MHKASNGMLALLVFALAGCGSSSHFADKASPPTPINLSVYVNDAKVSVSPNSIGAGPVIFIISNQATQSVQLRVKPVTGGSDLATTAPINPQATSSVSVDFAPGDYTLATSANANSLSSARISPASLHVKASRAKGNSVLLEP